MNNQANELDKHICIIYNIYKKRNKLIVYIFGALQNYINNHSLMTSIVQKKG